MPIYEYECRACGARFEVTLKFSDPALAACTLCSSPDIRKILSPTAFVLKGGGWYTSDYPSADRKKAAESEKPKDCSSPKPECKSDACSSGACPAKK